MFMLLFCAAQVSFGQLEAANWYFGDNAGLRFDPVTGAVSALTDGSLRTDEGCSTISDANGNLLFYTDGITVYNRNHIVMPNGRNLRGNPSSTQSGIIIPKPGDSDIYYIFTVSSGSEFELPYGMNYYEVDMTLNGGLGDVVTDVNNPTNLIPLCSEKIAAIKAENDVDIYVVGYADENGSSNNRFNTFYTFKITPTGVETIPVKRTFSQIVSERRGSVKFSSDGKHLVSANMGQGTYLYDFDTTTGIVSNEEALDLTFDNNQGYGVEFSPNNQYLYVSANNGAGANAPASFHQTDIYQFDVEKPTINQINASRISIYSGIGYRGALQLGVNGKIYVAQSDNYSDGRPFLGVINNPDIKGAGANYQRDAIPLASKLSRQGLPPFIQSFFASIDVENFCQGDDTLFSFESDTAPNSVVWDFGDLTSSTALSPSHRYVNPGVYDVVLTLDYLGTTRKFFKQIEIFANPVANAATVVDVCDTSNDGTESVPLTATISEILGTQDPQKFRVTFFTNQADADSSLNPIDVPIIINTTKRTLIARVDNIFNSECYASTPVIVNLFGQPVANPVGNLEVCDDNFDGILTFQMGNQTVGILGTQPSTDFTVSYHDSAANANGDLNPLPLSFRNTTTFRQTVFARIENNLKDTCVAVTSFDLVVQARPEAVDFNAFQCDEDGVIDNRTNFNLESFDQSIANNAANVSVSYHLNQNQADNNVGNLDKRDYRNTANGQTIIARVTDATTGCFNTATITLSVSASDAQDATLELCDDDGVQDGFQTFNLANANSAVLSSAPPNLNLNYYLTTSDALSERNPLPTQFTNSISGSQTIYARAESPDGNCYGISEVLLIVNNLPVVQPTAEFDYCGNDPQPLTIDAGILIGSPADYTYRWSTGETTYAIDVTAGGDYQVIVSNANGCDNDRVVTVIISEPATIDAIDTVNANGGRFGAATAMVSGLGDYEYRIDINAGYQISPVFEELTAGFYTIYVNDINGCGEVQQDFSIVGYPQFFTPNGDGFNDLWQLAGVNSIFEPDADIYIFDRFGKLVGQLGSASAGWDGTFNGEPLPSTDYWFKATLTDGTEFSSHFSLKR